MTAILGMLNGIEVVFVLLLGLLGSIFWIVMLVESARRLAAGEKDQLGWVVAIALTHFVGALVYSMLEHRKSARPEPITGPNSNPPV